MDEIQTLLLSTLPLWITEDAYRQLMVAAFPLNGTVVSFEQKKAEQAMSIPEIREYLKTHTYYQYETKKRCRRYPVRHHREKRRRMFSSRMNMIRHLWMMAQSHTIVCSES